MPKTRSPAFAPTGRVRRCIAVILAFVVPCMFIAAGQDAGLRGRARAINRATPMASGSSLIVSNPLGSVEIRTRDLEQLSVQARIVGDAANSVGLALNPRGGGLEIIVTGGMGRRVFGPPRMARCDLTIYAPKRIRAGIKTVNGTIEVTGIDGQARCESINGAIRLIDISGEIDAKTTTGGITATGLTPTVWERGQPTRFSGLRAVSVNGSIELENILGSIRANTTHGRISAKSLAGRDETISLESISGSLSIESVRPNTEVAMQTIAGKIDIQAPSFNIVEEGRNTKTVLLTGRLVRPAPVQKISMRTVSGNIVVK